MSFFRRLFGMQSAEELEREAEQHAVAGQFGSAKLTFERALEKLSADDTVARGRLSARIGAMRDGIAIARMAEAEHRLAAGDLDFALAEAQGAEEVAHDAAMRLRATELGSRIRGVRVVEDASPVRAQSRADRVAGLTANWSDDQSAEYEPVLDAILDGKLAMEDGDFELALERLSGASARIGSPAFVHRDVAHALWATGRLDDALESFRSFFARVAGEEHDRELFHARCDTARLLEELGRLEEALVEIETALDHAGDDPRSFTHVAHFLRQHGHATEAKEVLDAALTLPGSESDPVPQIELAYTESALGDHATALRRLDRIALQFRQTGHEPPREVESARARLLDRLDNAAHAAELHRRLATADDDGLAFEHALLAAAAYRKTGHHPEADRMLHRAESIARAHPAWLALVHEARAASKPSLGTP